MKKSFVLWYVLVGFGYIGHLHAESKTTDNVFQGLLKEALTTPQELLHKHDYTCVFNQHASASVSYGSRDEPSQGLKKGWSHNSGKRIGQDMTEKIIGRPQPFVIKDGNLSQRDGKLKYKPTITGGETVYFLYDNEAGTNIFVMYVRQKKWIWFLATPTDTNFQVFSMISGGECFVF